MRCNFRHVKIASIFVLINSKKVKMQIEKLFSFFFISSRPMIDIIRFKLYMLNAGIPTPISSSRCTNYQRHLNNRWYIMMNDVIEMPVLPPI